MTSLALNIPETNEFIADIMDFSIPPERVNQFLRNHINSIIVDVRDTKDFIRGHVPGAINLPKGNWGKISGLQYDLSMIIYCYSNTCPLGTQATQEFARHGYSVMEIEGGFKAWKDNKLPVEI
jgi:rhodanese-related sulfurtransferase